MISSKSTVKATGLNIWFNGEQDHHEPKVDVIAVQGLGADPYYTWVGKLDSTQRKISKHRRRFNLLRGRKENAQADEISDIAETASESAETMWLRDLLPNFVPHARIASYSYESDWRRADVKTSLRRCGQQLLNVLHQNRSSEKECRRPLVFLGHSLGGLIIKQALVLANHGDDFSNIRLSTAGIIFLGVPHQGSDAAVYGLWLAQAVGRDKTLLESLKKDSTVLYDIAQDFEISYRNADIVCFYENKEASYGSWWTKLVDQQSATLHGRRMIYLNTDHSGLNKFHGHEDENFCLVWPEIQRMVQQAPHKIEAQYHSTANFKPQSTRPLFLVPFIRDQQFVGRNSILDSIESRFKKTRRLALSGIGGVGKSQIAIEYCYRFKESNPQANVFWIYCSTVDRILQAYKNIAKKLVLPGWDDPKANTLEMVCEWLNNEDHGTWLLILDNADNKNVVSVAQLSPVEGHKPFALIDYVPRSSNGSIIVTTRDSRIGKRLTDREQPITVSEFDLEEACQLLKSKIPNGEDLDKYAHILLKRLEFLPLAITHAATYIDENEITVAKYIDMLQADDSELISLLDREELVDHRRDSKSSSSIMQTWKISFDQIQRQHHRAAQILSLMAILDRQGIPALLLRNDNERESDFIEGIGVLKAYSLITTEIEGETYFLHRLVQVFTQNWLELQEKRKDFEEAALQLLSVKFADIKYENWHFCEILLPHAQKILTYCYLSETCLLHRAALLCNMAWYETDQGRYDAAYQSSEKSYSERKKLLGNDHPATLTSMNILASVLEKQGNYVEGENLHRLTLEMRQKVLGKKHLNTLTSANNLAVVLYKQNKNKDAEELLRQTLETSQNVLGKEHPDSLKSMNCLALVLHRRGKLKEAEKLHQQTLKTRQKVLGKDHPASLASMNNLALVLENQGNYEDAEELHEQTLEISQKVLGKEHPHTLMSMGNLAAAWYRKGKYKAAKELLRQTLEIRQKVLGKEHPETLMSMSNLASSLAIQGKHEEAEDLQRQTLEISQKVLGKEHPRTLMSMGNLAVAMYIQGKHEEAEDLQRQTLKISQKMLGKEHPQTLRSRNNLASVLHNQGKHKEADDLNR